MYFTGETTVKKNQSSRKQWATGEFLAVFNRVAEHLGKIEEQLGENLLTTLWSLDNKTNEPYANFLVAEGGDYKKKDLKNLPKTAGDLAARYTLIPRSQIPDLPK
jgi:hypothetical protein